MPKKSKIKEKKEKKSYRIIKNSKPHAKEGQSINSSGISNLVRKRKGILLQGSMLKKKVTRSPRTLGFVRKRREVIKSLRTLNFVWKRGRALIHKEFQTSCGRRREYQVLNYFGSRAEENSNCKVHQKILNLARNRGRISGIIVMENLE